MNNSNGFNPSLMGSSAGFKKRNLLRPASGLLSKKVQFLRAVDLSQSEPVISTFLRGEIAAIEEEINLLDKDRKLRQGEPGLQKSYVTALRKWLQANQSYPERQDEDIKILRYLGVDNYEGGFKKLWKVLGHLDLTITKITELQVVHFLLYDEMFDGIGQDSSKASNLLTQICSHNYSPCTFQITQILLDRSKDLYSSCRKGGKTEANKQDDRHDKQNRQDRQDKQEKNDKQDKQDRVETNQLINQLKVQNAKLNSMLEQLSAEREQEKKRLSEKETSASSTKVIAKENQSPPVDRNSAAVHLKQIEQKYSDHIKFLNGQNNSAANTVSELKGRVSNLEVQLKAAGEKVPSLAFPPASSGSYEEALMEEMEKMKKGFEKKIAVLSEEFGSRERELRKKETDYKLQNQKIKWQKSLLLKKFDLMSK